MIKKSSKVFLTSLMLILTLSAMALLTGCGGTPTLEDYFNDNPKEQETLDAELNKTNKIMEQSGMSFAIDIKENQLTYTLKLGEMYKDQDMEDIRQFMDQYLDSVSTNYETIAKTMEDTTKIEGITVRVICLDPDDAEICSKEYKASK